MAFEVVMIKLLNIRPALPIGDLIEKLDDIQKQFSSAQELSLSETQKRFEAVVEPTDTKPQPAGQSTPPPVGIILAGCDSTGIRENPDPWQAILDIISERYPSLAPNLAHSRLVKQSQNTLE